MASLASPAQTRPRTLRVRELAVRAPADQADPAGSTIRKLPGYSRWLLLGCALLLPFRGSAQQTNAPQPDSPEAREDVADARALELFGQLGIEHRRYLVYLYSRLNKPRIASVLADRILSELPGDKQTLLTLASMHIDHKNVDAALYYGHKLTELFPGDEQARYYLGAALYLAGRFAESRDTLQGIKQERYKNRLYPYQGDLASATLLAEDWHRALIAYQELLQRHPLTQEVRLSARRLVERLYRLHLPQISFDATANLINSGSFYRTRLDYQRHVTDASLLLVEVSRDDTEVLERPLLRNRRTDRTDLLIGLQTVLNPKWTSRLSLGGSSGSGPVGSASLIRSFGERKIMTLEIDGNEPSLEGLLFQSLDGRRDRAVWSTDYALGKNWVILSEIYGWESVIERNRIGTGYGGNWNVERILIHNRPDLRVGYRGIWTRFSRDTRDTRLIAPAAEPGLDLTGRTTLLQGLLLPEFHRHGLYASWRGQLSSALSYSASAGMDYDITLGIFAKNGTLGIDYFPTRRIELKAETRYASSARTADAASSLWQINVAFKYWF
jgi:hypothetical protein